MRFHNLSDVSTSALVFLGFRVSKRPPTPRYPYGYERAEDLAGLGVALVIFASAVFAGIESYRMFVGHGTTTHLRIGMAGAVLGIVGNQIVARYKARVGRRIQSATLEADAKHSWLEALSSLGALVGLAAVGLGYRWGDPVAGFAVTLFILHVGWEVTTDLLHHLMDGLDPAVMGRAKSAAESVPGVKEATIWGRWTGRSLRIEVEGRLDGGLTLSQVERFAPQVEEAVRAAVEQTRDVAWPRSDGRSPATAPDVEEHACRRRLRRRHCVRCLPGVIRNPPSSSESRWRSALPTVSSLVVSRVGEACLCGTGAMS